MELQGIFLDMYGTIADGDRACVVAICARIIADLRLDLTPHDLSVAWGKRFFAMIESANGPRFRTLDDIERDSLVETLAALGRTADPAPYAEAMQRYRFSPPLHAEVRDALAALPLPVYVVSNADREDIVRALAFHDLSPIPFVTSECARSYKPDSAIFELALQRTGWDARRVLHVGDSLHSDVGGASRLGIRTAWVCRENRMHDIGEHAPDHQFSDLMQMAEFVRAGCQSAVA